jgi:hypothetical protein
MGGFGFEGFGTVHDVAIEAYTSAYRVSGRMKTRFTRVADILNQNTGAHLVIDEATIGEHGDPGAPQRVPQVLVPLSEVLLVLLTDEAGDGGAGSGDHMRIPKRGVRAQLGLPPFRLTGTVYVAQGSRPMDGLLNVPDRFLPMTDVAITSAAHPELNRESPVVALARDRAQVLIVADDERPDELLAEVLDEATAEAWLHSGQGHPAQEG